MKQNLDFMCVGVQKGGTTSLHDILFQNPKICLPELKETHFFRDEEKYQKGINHYFNYYFKPKPESKIWGEIDPEYLYFKKSTTRIQEEFGAGLKIVVILRNPVKRAFSHYLMTRRRGIETLSFKDAVAQEASRLQTHYNKIHFSYIDRGRYTQQIQRIYNTFGKQNCKIVVFESYIADIPKHINEISSFCNLPKFNYDTTKKSNSASVAKSKWLRDFLYKKNPLKKIGGKLIPSQKLKDKIIHFLDKKNLKKAPKEILEKDYETLLFTKYFKQDILDLEKLTDLNLEHWKNYN